MDSVECCFAGVVLIPMKLLTALFLLLAVSSFGAVPSYDKFIGAGGITVTKNPPNGTIVIDGSGVVSSGTNSSMQVSTNNVASSTMASNINFTAGNNTVLKGTNIGSTAHINYGIASNLTFYSTLGNLVLGTWDGVFGFSNAATASLSMWLAEPDTGNDWALAGMLIASNAMFTTLPGSGTHVGISASGTLFRTNAGSSAIWYANSVFVSTNGNNSTGTRGRIDLPFLTPVAAKVVAVAGDTVFVNRGNYPNSTNLFKNLVNWQGYGATLSHTNRTNDTGVGIFDDRFSGAVTSKISGFSFMYSMGLEKTNSVGVACCAPTNTLGPIVMTNALTSIDLDFDRIDYQEVNTSPRGAALNLQHGTNCYINGNMISDMNLTTDVVIGTDEAGVDVIAQSAASAIFWRRGEHHVNVKRMETRFYGIWPSAISTDVGNLWVESDYILGKFYSDAVSTNNWRVWCHVKEMRVNKTNFNATPINILGTGKFYFDFDKLGTDATTDTAMLVQGAAIVWLNAQKISATRRWIDLSGGASLYANVLEFEDLGAVDNGIDVAGGFLELKGNKATLTNATGSAVRFQSGGMSLQGLRISTTNSTGFPVTLSTNGAVFANCTMISKTGIPSVFAAAAQSVNLQGCWGRVAETNTVTYLVGPWTVDSNVR